ncbi:Dihydrolipoyllysine-residue acetyltransferase component of pyruvate dehydrogenase complex [Pigmentiphaga humi]|uniref:Dihydrolipoamide acetyltransferase component of pyruvate dehydrogenase complex n=1 Tax=Pigmentiphaga humi TaxID=2478468 RepID=A0A3P4AZ94_9BURK|nr:2-oxo acid dehydrogenase subunit E2 [Pigmentiphaga humi]VCU69353.1 Dihydrolipoyllysine-residue acetyltransferase component of pyruvate dehydrogenase complex [Pigmentiphaga humi]
MSTPLLMPALSPTMTEGGIVGWRKKEGEDIRAGDILVEIETDKAVMEVEAAADGVLERILVPADGAPVAVGTAIAMLGDGGEARAPAPPRAPEREPPAATPSAAIPQTGARADPPQARKAVTPIARRLAAELGVDASRLAGSGPGGRVLKADVMNAAESRRAHAPADAPSGDACVRLTVDCEVDDLAQWMSELNGEGLRLALEHFVVAACVRALNRFPQVNATRENGSTVRHADANIAVAVPTPDGLAMPVLLRAQDKGIVQLSEEMRALEESARQGALVPEQSRGGTFAVLDAGRWGVRTCSAPVQAARACTLSLGAAERRPVARGDGVAVATVMSCTLTVDPGLVDVAAAAAFLADIKQSLERILTMLL